MINIHLLVDENYIEEFVKTFPQDKVIIVEKEFEENKKLYENIVNKYRSKNTTFKPYSQSMDEMTQWLKDK